MRNERVRIIVEIALAVALAAVLNYFGVRLPWNIAGGRIALDMLPIFVIALRRGVGPGLITGALWGFADLLFDPYIVHPAQLIFDYPLAFALCGLAGLGRKQVAAALTAGASGRAAGFSAIWAVVGGVGRFLSHVTSGVIFFADAAPAGQPVLLYSVVYNMSYMGPSIAVCAILTAVLVPALERAVPAITASGRTA